MCLVGNCVMCAEGEVIFALKNFKYLPAFILFVVLGTGCSSVMVPVSESPATSSSSSLPETAPSTVPESKSGGAMAVPEPEAQPAGDVIVPNHPVQNASSRAVAKLIEDAWRYNRSGEYDRSNSVAERAMRIDHTEPEIYLVMASNYFASAQLHLAEQLASQGLPFAGGNSSVKRSLQQLLSNIRTKSP